MVLMEEGEDDGSGSRERKWVQLGLLRIIEMLEIVVRLKDGDEVGKSWQC